MPDAGAKGLVKRARVGRSSVAGWGLIASTKIRAGETVDESPLLVTRGRLPDELDGHAYELPDGRRGFPCGDGIFVNHARPANATTKPDLRRRIMRLVALRDIASGEEVTFDYGDDW